MKNKSKEQPKFISEEICSFLNARCQDKSVWSWDTGIAYLLEHEIKRIGNAIKDDYKSHVLIIGETGTGKELVAEEIRKMAGMSDVKYITINCVAISPNLLDSELFGHVNNIF